MSLSLQRGAAGRRQDAETDRRPLLGQWAGWAAGHDVCSRASWWVQAGSWGRGGARARKAVLEAAPVWPAAGGDGGRVGSAAESRGRMSLSGPGPAL